EADTLVARGPSERRGERNEPLARCVAWADLLKRLFEFDALRCPGRGGRMRLVAAITEASVARRILECLSLPPRAPPLEPASDGELETVLDFDAREPALSESDAERDFDFSHSQIVNPTSDDAS
ncbi:hypothetical protein K2X89_02470, partial [Myxococcota bacterium]|nr:hypothetical protein [Myxococcota bacterium]